MKAIGLMSGTSLDGLDIAYCEVNGFYTDTRLQVLAFEEVQMPEVLKKKILQACSGEKGTTPLVCSLNFELGEWMGISVHSFLEKYSIRPEEVAFIASHGQTIWHQPIESDGYKRSTLQIGEPAEIAWHTGIPVISNFRTMDMAAGGQGAPLVPYADYVLYRSTEKTRVLLNLGGIANVTFIPKECSEDDVLAFDTGPADMMIDEAMRQLYGREYDDNGEIASSGKVSQEMIDQLMKDPYIAKKPPKSTGREAYGKTRTREILQEFKELKSEDLIATLTAYTARSTASNIHTFLDPICVTDEVLVSGGGAHNQCLMKMLQEAMNEAEVKPIEEEGISSDAKEAAAFVILGNETMHRHYANMISATGAHQRVILGNITPINGGMYEEQ